MSSPSYRLTLTSEQRKALLLVCDVVLAMLAQLETVVLMEMIVSARDALESGQIAKEKIAA